jgi:hypothetical protein
MALARCLKSVLALSRSESDLVLNIGDRLLNSTGSELPEAPLSPAPEAWAIELNIFTAGREYRLDSVLQRLPQDVRIHTVQLDDPRQLPLACRDWLIAAEPLTDLSLYLEDDLIITDELYLDKQFWFLQQWGNQAVMMPHRWEPIPGSSGQRLLVDGPLRADVIQRFTQPKEAVRFGSYRGEEIYFDRTSNPHSGCFCLNRAQVVKLRSCELPREGFVGPLETAATLTVLQSFEVLKPALSQRRFLWIEHGHPSFQSYARSWSIEESTSFNNAPREHASISASPAHTAYRPATIGNWFPDQGDPQRPTDVAIVMPTILRPEITRAIQSIYQQDFQGRIQILIGVDKQLGPIEPLLECLKQRPANVSALVLTMPWSTSERHGGIHKAMDTGSLRTVLSFMANSRLITYLDDDNTILQPHIKLLIQALKGKAWAFTQRFLVDDKTNENLGIDQWDSVGPNRGRMAKQGGFVDTNCLMIDKLHCGRALPLWSEGPGMTADRSFFSAIRNAPYGEVAEATVRYYIRKDSILHSFIASNARFT